jgi:hypothetical protein
MLAGSFCRGMDGLSAVCACVSWLDDRVDALSRGHFARRGDALALYRPPAKSSP